MTHHPRIVQHFRPGTLYRDLERSHDTAPETVIAAAYEACAKRPTLWVPSHPDRNPAEVLAVLGAIWASRQLGLVTCWDGAALRGDDPLPVLARRRIAKAGKGGLHIGDIVVALRGVRADLWTGHVTLERIWLKYTSEPLDWSAQTLDGTITGYDPTTYALPLDLGFNYLEHGYRIASRPAVEISAILGAEALHRANAWHYEPDGMRLPAIAGVPLRDWNDVRTFLTYAERGWRHRRPYSLAGWAQQPSWSFVPIVKQGYTRRLAWMNLPLESGRLTVVPMNSARLEDVALDGMPDAALSGDAELRRRLVAAQQSLGLSRRAFAAALLTPRQTVDQWANGVRRTPGIAVLAAEGLSAGASVEAGRVGRDEYRQRLTVAQELLGMSLPEFAEALLTPRQTLGQWLNGRRRTPGVALVAAEVLIRRAGGGTRR